mgnify:FL=1
MIRNYPVHPVVTITIAAAVTVRDLRGRAVVLVLPDPEAVPVPLVQWDLRAPRVNPDFKATQVLSDLLEPLALPDLSELPEPLALPDLPELSDLLAAGPIGPTGAAGPAGPTGATGATGPAGTVAPAAAVADATGQTDIVTQFNQLLANLRAAGLLAT